jgi:hypothetical protein
MHGCAGGWTMIAGGVIAGRGCGLTRIDGGWMTTLGEGLM